MKPQSDADPDADLQPPSKGVNWVALAIPLAVIAAAVQGYIWWRAGTLQNLGRAPAPVITVTPAAGYESPRQNLDPPPADLRQRVSAALAAGDFAALQDVFADRVSGDLNSDVPPWARWRECLSRMDPPFPSDFRTEPAPRNEGFIGMTRDYLGAYPLATAMPAAPDRQPPREFHVIYIEREGEWFVFLYRTLLEFYRNSYGEEAAFRFQVLTAECLPELGHPAPEAPRGPGGGGGGGGGMAMPEEGIIEEYQQWLEQRRKELAEEARNKAP